MSPPSYILQFVRAPKGYHKEKIKCGYIFTTFDTLSSYWHLIPGYKETAASSTLLTHFSHRKPVMVKPASRKLKISGPIIIADGDRYADAGASSRSSPTQIVPRSTPDNSVIVIAKFNFKAENKHEISIGIGEAFKLVQRKGNGWILVKPIGRLGECGLIPASYVRIVKIDKSHHPQTDEEWLSQPETHCAHKTTLDGKNKSTSMASEISAISDSGEDFTYQSSISSVSSTSQKNSATTSPKNSMAANTLATPIPLSGLVKNADTCNGRYWYRVDVSMSNGKTRHLCRYYQDFYKLHCALVDQLVRSNPDQDINELVTKLPTLPDPIARPDLQTLQSILLQRCQCLNVYIFRVIQNRLSLNYGNIVNEWVELQTGDLELSDDLQISNKEIQEMLSPMTTQNTTGKQRPVLSVKTSVTPPLPMLNQHMYRSSSVSSASSTSSPSVWTSPPLQSNPSFSHSTPTILEGEATEFNDWLTSPIQPLLVPRRDSSSLPTGREAKAKVFYNNDIFALRFKPGCRLDEVKGSIARRLECDVDALVLRYKIHQHENFIPLDTDGELNMAMEYEKFNVDVQLLRMH